jgi:aerobic-type carbon monoxide dehydrogenase small subunit (CoxS/CutS family)
MSKMTLQIDGVNHEDYVPLDQSLSHSITDQLKFKARKFTCGLAQCGKYFVLVNNQSIRSCAILTGLVSLTAAIANAVVDATNLRIHQYPLSPQRFKSLIV